MKFNLIKKEEHSEARVGEIHTGHGKLNTPVFIPVGTLGSVKGVNTKDLEEKVQSPILLSNTYHLYLRPGTDILEAAGGVKGNLKAVITGGLSVPILKADEIEGLNMDYDSCIKHGTALGSGGIMVINDEFSIPELAYRTISFYAHESCGRCAPCRNGSHSIKELLGKLLEGEGTKEDIDTVVKICDSVNGVTICPTGEAFCVPIKAMVEKFRDEFEALVKE